MAKRRNNSTKLTTRRDLPRIATGIHFTSPVLSPITIKKQLMSSIQDGRKFTPRPVRPRTLKAQVAKIKATVNPLLNVSFSLPKNALVCVRRKMRKQVLFATGGAGKKFKKRPRRNENSQYHC